MPKYKKKLTKTKIVNQPKIVKKVKIQQPSFSLRKTSAVGLLLLSVLISLYFIHKKTNAFDDFIPVSDELTIINAIENYAPTHSAFRNIIGKYEEKITSDLSPYMQEIYMRYAVFNILKNSQYDWKPWSSLSYLYILFISIILLTIFGKNTYNIVIPIAFTIIFASVSYWTSASFHFIRYQSFIIMMSILVLFINTNLYINKRINIFLRSVIIIILSAFPALFHNQGAFMLIFWLGVVFLSLLINTIKSKNILHYAIFAIVVLAGSYIFIMWGMGNVQHGLNKFDLAGFYPILTKFIELSFPHDWLGILITTLIFVSPVLSWKYFSKFDKNLLILSAILFVMSTLLSASIMGNRYSGYNGANRYFTFTYTIQLVLFAALFTGIYKFAVAKINFKFNKEIIFIVLIVPLVFGIYNTTTLNPEIYNFSLLPQIRKSVLKQQKAHIQDIDYAVIGVHTGNTKSAFPKHKVYGVNFINNRKNIDSLKEKYLLFYYVPENMMSDSIKLHLKNKGTIITELFIVNKNSLK